MVGSGQLATAWVGHDLTDACSTGRILGQDVADVDFEPADHRARIRRGAHHALVENGGGVDLAARPRTGLPGPDVSGRA